MEYQQKNPLKYYALPFLFEFVNKVNQDIDPNLIGIHNICIIFIIELHYLGKSEITLFICHPPA
jgi:hypothetical protein